MSGYMQNNKVPKRLFHAMVHTCVKSNRYKVLKGLAALVVDVSLDTGDIAFALTTDLYRKYLSAGSSVAMQAWYDEVRAHYRMLHDRHPTSWMRLLHNPNIAFMENTSRYQSTSGLLAPRTIVAQEFIAIMEEEGYKLAWGEKK